MSLEQQIHDDRRGQSKIIFENECYQRRLRRIYNTIFLNWQTSHRLNILESKINPVPLSKSTYFKRFIFPDDTEIRIRHPYRKLVGCLLYISVCTLPGIYQCINYHDIYLIHEMYIGTSL